eukprot:TRINITY_DN11202_c0_g1_i2.p1 TRINITY_DN11202_c0_g1~~TRINITY_DN11202_c0_g1_i2.p1  ORF type:complete len:293 (+),score=34.47 TRINITY_DN11202_c0_g1_i2:25-903(+)
MRSVRYLKNSSASKSGEASPVTGQDDSYIWQLRGTDSRTTAVDLRRILSMNADATIADFKRELFPAERGVRLISQGKLLLDRTLLRTVPKGAFVHFVVNEHSIDAQSSGSVSVERSHAMEIMPSELPSVARSAVGEGFDKLSALGLYEEDIMLRRYEFHASYLLEAQPHRNPGINHNRLVEQEEIWVVANQDIFRTTTKADRQKAKSMIVNRNDAKTTETQQLYMRIVLTVIGLLGGFFLLGLFLLLCVRKTSFVYSVGVGFLLRVITLFTISLLAAGPTDFFSIETFLFGL